MNQHMPLLQLPFSRYSLHRVSSQAVNRSVSEHMPLLGLSFGFNRHKVAITKAVNQVINDDSMLKKAKPCHISCFQMPMTVITCMSLDLLLSTS